MRSAVSESTNGDTLPVPEGGSAQPRRASAPSCTIERFAPADRGEWDRFVLQHPHGTPFHLIAWKETIEQTFGYEPIYLVAREGPTLQGLLPLFLIQNPIIGRVLISSPFAVYGGILATGTEVQKALYEYAIRLGSDAGVDYIEFRNHHADQCVGTSNVSRYVSFSQPLFPDSQTTLDGLPKKTRNLVRKALKTPFTMRYDVQDLKNFEQIYASNMRRLGTPVFPAAYFSRLKKNFGAMVDVREVWFQEKPVAVSLNFLFRDDMHIYYAAADTRYNSLGPNTYMYFDHLCWGGANDYKTFDFGRCKRGTTIFEFKRHWNTVMRELPYEIVLGRRKELPNFSPTNPRFALWIRLWRLLPLPVTRLLGPRLIQFFP